MKQLLSLFLFFLPCLAWAQYPSNGNQKITLGEQSTADGLIYRGVLGDTALITPSSDTSAYIILDTVNHRFYNYNRATNVWSVAGGGTAVTTFSAGTTGFTPSTATSGAVTLAGTLPVANGGTNRTTMPAGYILHGDGTSVDTAIGLFWSRNVNRLGINNNNPAGALDVKGEIILNAGGVQFPAQFRNDFTPTSERADLFFFSNFISNNGFRWGTLASSGGVTFQGTRANDSGIKTNINFNPDGGDVGIGTTSPTQKLHVVGNGLFTGNVGIGSATPTTSGSGITFPSTQSASTNVNTLDDYEEGTWTPIVIGNTSTSGQTYEYQTGRYIKIGRNVYCTFELQLTAAGTVSGISAIAGLPFATSGTGTKLDAGGLVFSFYNNLNSNQIVLSGYAIDNESKMFITSVNSAGVITNNITITDLIKNNTRLAGFMNFYSQN
jgi:hypothetical protein